MSENASIKPTKDCNVRFVPGSRLSFRYKNWKGRVAERKCLIESFGYIVNEFHTGWCINGLDLDKGVRRSYHLGGIDPHTIKVL